jgi:hypothetical protein
LASTTKAGLGFGGSWHFQRRLTFDAGAFERTFGLVRSRPQRQLVANDLAVVAFRVLLARRTEQLDDFRQSTRYAGLCGRRVSS